MNIGFVNIYAFRPHVEHLFYLSLLAKEAGYGTFALSCPGSSSLCYPKALKHSPSLKECAKCLVGGVLSYPFDYVDFIGSKESSRRISDAEIDRLLVSSSATLNRVESQQEWHTPELRAARQALSANFRNTFHSAVRWIEKNKLSFVVCFNGRMDMTRAITYACETMGIPYVTHERTWFGDGIQLVPNANCLSIGALHRMTAEYEDKLLTSEQAQLAARFIASRFTKQNNLEWRLYNKDATKASWPTQTSKARILVLPSSKNEFAGHDEWVTEWDSNTDALDALFEKNTIFAEQVVLRCHPNWSETIGKISGTSSESLYTDWAKRKGIHCIRSAEKADTYDLIQQADIVIMNGGSSSVEAAACGKKVICLGPSTYQMAGFCDSLLSYADIDAYDGLLDAVDQDQVLRSNLRYIYLRAARFPQYVPHVKAITTTSYRYFAGADPMRLIDMAMSGGMIADDASFADSSNHEDKAVAQIMARDWAGIMNSSIEKSMPLSELHVGRRTGLQWIDGLRSKLPRGDR